MANDAFMSLQAAMAGMLNIPCEKKEELEDWVKEREQELVGKDAQAGDVSTERKP